MNKLSLLKLLPVLKTVYNRVVKKDVLKTMIPGDIVKDIDIDEPLDVLSTLAGRYLDSDSILNVLEAVVAKKMGYEYYDIKEDTVPINPLAPKYFEELQALSDRMLYNAAALRVKADSMIEEAELLEKEAKRYVVEKNTKEN